MHCCPSRARYGSRILAPRILARLCAERCRALHRCKSASTSTRSRPSRMPLRRSSSTTRLGEEAAFLEESALLWPKLTALLVFCSLSSVRRKFDAGVEAGVYPAAPKLEDMDAAAFAHLQDQREWEVCSALSSFHVQCLTHPVPAQLLMEYVLPFASMIKGAALPTLPAPPSLPEYGTHKVSSVQTRCSQGWRPDTSALFPGLRLPELVHARAFGLLRSCWRAHPAAYEGGSGRQRSSCRCSLGCRHARAYPPMQHVPAGTWACLVSLGTALQCFSSPSNASCR